jgi:hypothetical protein
MADMDAYTINDDLRACGLPGDDEDDLASSGEALFGSLAAPINVDGGDAGAAGAAGAGDPPPPPPPLEPPMMPSCQSVHTSGVKRSRSPAWNDFDEIFDTLPTGKKVRIAAKCKHCGHVLSGRSSAGTGHLLRHQKVCVAKTKHAALVQSRIAFSADGSVYNWEYKTDVSRRELCHLIARLDLPLGFGFESAFEEYIRRAHNPRFTSVSRQITTRDLEKYFLGRRSDLIESFKSVSFVCLTSDIWSGNAKEDYLSVVVHYVSADWELEKREIGLSLIDCSNNGVNIADRVDSVVTEFGLNDKVFSVTLDNASSNASAMSKLIPKFIGYLGTDPDPLDKLCGLLHQRCACHIINLIVKSGLKRIKVYLEAFRTAISYLNSSNQRIAEFRNFCLVKGF